jgi:hypothetical protein
MSDFFFPRLEAVEAPAPWRLCTRWSTGEVLEVDVEGVLRATPPLAPILDPAVFATARLAEGGRASNGSTRSSAPTTCMPGPRSRPAR